MNEQPEEEEEDIYDAVARHRVEVLGWVHPTRERLDADAQENLRRMLFSQYCVRCRKVGSEPICKECLALAEDALSSSGQEVLAFLRGQKIAEAVGSGEIQPVVEGDGLGGQEG